MAKKRGIRMPGFPSELVLHEVNEKEIENIPGGLGAVPFAFFQSPGGKEKAILFKKPSGETFMISDSYLRTILGATIVLQCRQCGGSGKREIDCPGCGGSGAVEGVDDDAVTG